LLNFPYGELQKNPSEPVFECVDQNRLNKEQGEEKQWLRGDITDWSKTANSFC